MKPVSLIIPVYNESGSVAALVPRLAKVLAQLPGGSEVVLVNDGSRDGSGEALAQALEGCTEPIRLMSHARNRGYGAALKTGIAHSTCPWIAITDADGTYPLGKLPRLLREMDGGATMAVGARRLGEQPLVRRPAKAFLNAFASFLAESPIPDINSGLRVFTREAVLRHIKLMPDGFSFTTTITMALLGEGEPVVYVPIRYRARVGESKIRPVRDMMNFLLLICRMAVLFNPLKVFVPAALVFVLASFCLLLARLFLAESVGVATTIVLFVAGVQMFAIGLLADLINRRR